MAIGKGSFTEKRAFLPADPVQSGIWNDVSVFVPDSLIFQKDFRSGFVYNGKGIIQRHFDPDSGSVRKRIKNRSRH